MPNRFWMFIAFFLASFFLGSPWSSLKAEELFSTSALSGQEAWDIEAQELSYDKEKDLFTASGQVVIKKGKNVLKCEFAEVDRRTMIARAKGKVEFEAAGDIIHGDEITVDLQKNTGEIKNGRLFLKRNNYHVTGEQIWKTGESSYRVINGTVTTCEGENVPWEITAKEIEVTIDGYGQAWHPSFRVKKIPLLYSPFAFFPAKTTRQSGLLMPEISQSSRDGFSVNLPIYWAISGNTDATFHEYFMSRRGFMQGTEFRYVLSPLSKGTLMLDYLFKDGISREEFNAGNINKPYSERYWFRSKINQGLPANMDLKLDLDWVSDRDYLKEFRSTPNGLNRNRSTFLSNFGRDLEDETVTARRNAAIITKNFGTANFTGGFNYYQDVDETKTLLNQLPYGRFDMTKQVLAKDFLENLFFQWGSSFNHYWRENLDRGQVLELNPILSYPAKFKTFLNLEGTVGLTETLYSVDNKLNSAVESFGNRTVPNFRLDGSTDIQKIFVLSGGEIEKIKHNIRPQIIYNYIPEIKQESLPTFVPTITKTNTVSYFLINTFTSKSLIKKGRLERTRDELLMGFGEFLDDGSQEDLYGYRDFFQFKIYQTYDINEAQRTITPSSPQERRPFSNVTGEMEILPGPNFSLRSYANWSPYTGQMDSHSHNLSLSDKKGNLANVEYLSLSGDQIRQINSNLVWKINTQWSANFLNRYSLDQNKNYETAAALTYAHQCWGIKLTYSNTPDNTTYFLSFSLKGLADF